MKLALPLGLLGLLAILALVLIYILKPKYQDKKVSSTYVWKLSLRYRKRKVPLQWLKSSLLLIIQLLIIILIALMMSQPQVVLATKTGEKIVILEASASMQTEKDGKSRFDRAKSEISRLAESTTAEEDKFSVILAAEEASFVIRRSDSASYIKQKISEAECTFGESDLPKAMELAEGVLAENPNAEVYLYTDCEYEKTGKVTVVNVADSEWNAAVLNFSAKRVKGSFVFTAEIASYGRASEIAVNLNVDGKMKSPKLADCKENGKVSVVWDNLDITDYATAEIHISADDGFAYDNDFYIFGPKSERFRVQLAGTPNSGFLFSALYAVGTCQVDFVDLMSADENGKFPVPATSGYDLYVYDGTYPEVMPTDGAILLVAPPDDLPSEWWLNISGKRSGNFTFTSSGGSSEAYKTIMNGITPSSIQATEYSRILSYLGYESIMQCGVDPVLLVKNEGVRTAVLAMDVHMSDIAMLIDFPLLINNLCKYAMPSTVESPSFKVGETVTVNAKVNTQLLEITAKYSAGAETQESYTEFPVVLNPDAAGVFTVTQSLSSGRTVIDQYFVRIPEKESIFYQPEKTLVNPVVMNTAGSDVSVQNDTMSIYVYLAAALLAFLCLEWGLQYREQY